MGIFPKCTLNRKRLRCSKPRFSQSFVYPTASAFNVSYCLVGNTKNTYRKSDQRSKP